MVSSVTNKSKTEIKISQNGADCWKKIVAI